MADLREYRRRRDPERTPEPVPAQDPPAEPGGDRFVIQEHHARRLHYDVRLERDGVLVSFAVPKNLPAQSGETRLAVHTEDHPLEYLTFHGEIPKGEYGAGSMTIWDSGRYETEKWNDNEIAVTLHGERTQGRFVFFCHGEGRDWMVRRRAAARPDAASPSPTGAVHAPVVTVEGRRLKLSNLDKVLYPVTGFTKGEMIDYYTRIAPVLLPYLADRPVTLRRYPDGVDGQSFFEKNVPSHAPDWVRTPEARKARRPSISPSWVTWPPSCGWPTWRSSSCTSRSGQWDPGVPSTRRTCWSSTSTRGHRPPSWNAPGSPSGSSRCWNTTG
jgi:DNA ligase D-like protein (predicted 3'-phosphoesterase)